MPHAATQTQAPFDDFSCTRQTYDSFTSAMFAAALNHQGYQDSLGHIEGEMLVPMPLSFPHYQEESILYQESEPVMDQFGSAQSGHGARDPLMDLLFPLPPPLHQHQEPEEQGNRFKMYQLKQDQEIDSLLESCSTEPRFSVLSFDDESDITNELEPLSPPVSRNEGSNCSNRNECKLSKKKYSANRFRPLGAQLELLMAQFEKNAYPSKKEADEIASELNATGKQVRVWFQNRRGHLRTLGQQFEKPRRAVLFI
ncbi:hypothetical protein BCR33DRAFT_779644 [Rhizoclosmatium globosum]|uniref:Homeobox domain-containing protein n=1 Tax=Rhizoclosmatium globosum TaxID=329046 RepID=A0A1Y2CZD5_9FUNG|nr:hypothetical protein BCR33DRAFT_779644 [Rhizoclosmatium globosum]|eukprot:ORY52317.1 hypothetical protein BCR33DRAFT_779644 [Rhizoclosmatium globosum]